MDNKGLYLEESTLEFGLNIKTREQMNRMNKSLCISSSFSWSIYSLSTISTSILEIMMTSTGRIISVSCMLAEVKVCGLFGTDFLYRTSFQPGLDSTADMLH